MIKPIDILLSNTPISGNGFFDTRHWPQTYVLPGAEWSYQQKGGCRILEQWYDTPDTFISLVSLQVEESFLRLPFQTTHHDLYSVHAIKGGVLLHGQAASNQIDGYIPLDQGQYRLGYLPPARYQVSLEKGNHLIFYTVLKHSLLFRESSPELDISISPVHALRDRLGDPLVSPAREMPMTASQRIRHFLRNPGQTYLQRLVSLGSLTPYLLGRLLDDIRLQEVMKETQMARVQRIQAYIRQEIAKGEILSVEELAKVHCMSTAYLRKLFVTNIKHGVIQYINEEKLRFALQLLESGDSIKQIAYFLVWTPPHFRKAFKAKYGISPQAYRKSLKDGERVAKMIPFA